MVVQKIVSCLQLKYFLIFGRIDSLTIENLDEIGNGSYFSDYKVYFLDLSYFLSLPGTGLAFSTVFFEKV